MIVSVKNGEVFSNLIAVVENAVQFNTRYTTGTLLNFLGFIKITLHAGLQHVKSFSSLNYGTHKKVELPNLIFSIEPSAVSAFNQSSSFVSFLPGSNQRMRGILLVC